jgi:hypothetical protein
MTREQPVSRKGGQDIPPEITEAVRQALSQGRLKTVGASVNEADGSALDEFRSRSNLMKLSP